MPQLVTSESDAYAKSSFFLLLHALIVFLGLGLTDV